MSLKDFDFKMATKDAEITFAENYETKTLANVYGMCGAGMQCAGGGGMCGAGMKCAGGGGMCGAGMQCGGQ